MNAGLAVWSDLPTPGLPDRLGVRLEVIAALRVGLARAVSVGEDRLPAGEVRDRRDWWMMEET
ncbi:MAG: hypothetical protein PHU43_01240 [Candidatus Bipolaricaulis sp.]|nr:hypothetical protein [Candidatus Bipolaricaulis sp.]